MIELKHVKKSYGEATPLKDINTVINEGDVIAVIGPSGTGKSTLLRMINALEPVTEGQVLIDGVDITNPKNNIPALRRKVGMVFQSFNLFSHLTVIENIMKPQTDILKRSRQEAYDRGVQLLKDVGIYDKAFQYPEDMSGGQKQRAAIARTLAMDPEVILFDEPTSALDPRMVSEVEAVIQQLAEKGRTMLIVTHEMRFAEKVSNRVFFMDEGLIYEDGPTQQVFHAPLKEKTRQFVKNVKMLELKLEDENFDFAGMMGQISLFSYTNQFSRTVRNRLVSVFEELCVQILKPADALPACFTAEIENEVNRQERISISCSYGRRPFVIDQTENEAALKILMFEISGLTYEELSDSEDYCSKVTMSLAAT